MRAENILAVSADKWAEHCSDYRTIGSETVHRDMPQGYKDSLICRSVETDEIIGMVDYYHDGRREYFISLNPAARKINFRKGV